MFKNARGRRVEAGDDDRSTDATSEDARDPEEPLVVKRTPRLRSTKPEPDTSD
jgi:hypothetical protein